MKVVKLNGDIDIHIIRKRNSKRIIVRVDKRSRVLVTSPTHVTYREILNFSLTNIEKIKEMLKDSEARNKEYNLKYLDNEIHYVWGKAYRLKLISANYNKIVLDSELVVYSKSFDREYIKKLLDKFYKNEIEIMIDSCRGNAESELGVKVAKYRIRDMISRWGTCNINKKIITLNLQLAKKDPACLEAVFYHELVHLLERNHTKRFYDLMDDYYPNWRNIEKRLHSSPYNEK
ncbi:M48 family metallopeptidase [Gemella sp. 19428wG2_WT2a]|nr:M48 family metallopeptidase [Gemella sp. 19428wG2_WT2a]TFU59582.1 M48 family peptidase [Gemella sp. WT2a]